MMRRLARDKAAALAALLLSLVVLAAIFAPIVAPYDPYFTDLSKAMQSPSDAHWFGTDTAGRDVLSRVIYGSRNTLALGLIGVIVGGLFGGFSASWRPTSASRRLDHAHRRHHAGLSGDPARARRRRDLRRRPERRVIALVVATIPDVARVARGAAIGVMGQEFMEAGRAVGVSDRR